jgi:D-glycero-beta-D-manno-heptose-7-phosphate kinase
MNVLVIGDYCQDIFVRGRADRLCPEAPCPVLNPTTTEYNDGMAGNVAANVRSLAPDCHMSVVFQPDIIRKTRYVDATSGYILLRVDENDKVKKPIEFEALKREIESGRPMNTVYDIVLISDYNKGFLTEEVIQQVTAYMQKEGALVFLDTKKILGSWSKNVDFVKINEKECRQQSEHHHDPLSYCRHLIVTLGARGSRYANTNVVVPSTKVEVMDVSGAGDTYFAAFALRYAEHKDIIDAMGYANRAAAVAVSKHGVVAVNREEINLNINF